MLIAGLVVSSAALAADNDQEITNQVKSKISDAIRFAPAAANTQDGADPMQGGISVETSDGVVSLRGYVDSVWKKKEAGKIASSVTGVQRVRNGLIISDGRQGKND
jgi:osmotically-inducible protein OsmY